MDIRVMRMPVQQTLVPMKVGVRFACGVVGAMQVLMMLIVDVTVFVHQHPMFMQVLVPLEHMEIDPEGHQGCRGAELPCDRIPKSQDSEGRAKEWRG